MIDKSLIAVALMGAHWVLYLLVGLSIVSVGIMIERTIFYARRRVDSANLGLKLAQLLELGDVAGAEALVAEADAMEARVVHQGLRALGRGLAAHEVMDGELTRQRSRFERRLLFLGTLG